MQLYCTKKGNSPKWCVDELTLSGRKKAAIMKEGSLAAVDDVKNMAASGARHITIYGISSVLELFGVESAEIAENMLCLYIYCGVGKVFAV